MNHKWNYRPITPEEEQASEQLARELGISPILGRLLIQRGITTATVLWVMSAIGMIIGNGNLKYGIIATIFLYGCLILLRRFEVRYIKSSKLSRITLIYDYSAEEEILRTFWKHDISVLKHEVESIENTDGEETYTKIFDVSLPENLDIGELSSILSKINKIHNIEIE